MVVSDRVRELLDAVALTEEDYQKIVEDLGREPTELELGIYGSLWSEHSGYRYSKALLMWLPTEIPTS